MFRSLPFSSLPLPRAEYLPSTRSIEKKKEEEEEERFPPFPSITILHVLGRYSGLHHSRWLGFNNRVRIVEIIVMVQREGGVNLFIFLLRHFATVLGEAEQKLVCILEYGKGGKGNTQD